MKFTRFELHAEPGTVRSGIYHESRFYETDGENAIGIHDPGSVKLLSPVGLSPAVRAFDIALDASGHEIMVYNYLNSSRVFGPGADLDASGTSEELDLEIRIAVVTQEGGRNFDTLATQKAILGFGTFLTFYEPEQMEQLLSLGLSTSSAKDIGSVFGPFLVTPDELNDRRSGNDPHEYVLPVKLEVNNQVIFETEVTTPPLSQILACASQSGDVVSGEILVLPQIEKPALRNTALERGLLATDKVNVTIDPIGPLVCKIL